MTYLVPRRQRNPADPRIVLAAVGAGLVVGGIVYWLSNKASASQPSGGGGGGGVGGSSGGADGGSGGGGGLPPEQQQRKAVRQWLNELGYKDSIFPTDAEKLAEFFDHYRAVVEFDGPASDRPPGVETWPPPPQEIPSDIRLAAPWVVKAHGTAISSLAPPITTSKINMRWASWVSKAKGTWQPS